MSEVTKSELDLLKERANVMGITYSPNIGVETLKRKIEAALAGNDPDADTADSEAPVQEPVGESPQEKRMRLNREARVLRRIRITCMNPNKKSMTGEIFTVSNAVVGTIKRFVPFDAEDGWHVEEMILKMIKARKFQTFYTVKLQNGRKARRGKLVPEFAVEMLKPLTQKELGDLAKRQAISGSLAEE